MAENETPETQTDGAAGAAAAGDTAARQQFAVQKIYIKDQSFESPSAPGIFQEESQGQPQLQMNLTQRVSDLGNALYEVVLSVTVTCNVGEKTAYLAEVQQAGVFHISGLQPDQLQATLGAYCPTVLFPYARQQISEMVAHGGFQPLLLQPVNFDQLFAEQMRKRAEEAQAGQAAGTDA